MIEKRDGITLVQEDKDRWLAIAGLPAAVHSTKRSALMSLAGVLHAKARTALEDAEAAEKWAEELEAES